jgi:tellurite resistance protein TehA-like permease
MMDGMGGMMWGAGLLWLLLIVVLVLAAVALIKYIRSERSK